MKNDKLKTRKPRKSRKSRKYYSEFSYFQVFDLPYSRNRKLGFKNLEKNFRVSQDFRVVPVFYLAQLELGYLNQKRWWDVYVCFMILLNVQYIMLNKFNKNSFRHSDLTYFLAEQNFKEMKKTSGFTKISLNRN